MSGRAKRKRMEQRERAKRVSHKPRPCPNCGLLLGYKGGHFVPPSLGDLGHFVCSPDPV